MLQNFTCVSGDMGLSYFNSILPNYVGRLPDKVSGGGGIETHHGPLENPTSLPLP